MLETRGLQKRFARPTGDRRGASMVKCGAAADDVLASAGGITDQSRRLATAVDQVLTRASGGGR